MDEKLLIGILSGSGGALLAFIIRELYSNLKKRDDSSETEIKELRGAMHALSLELVRIGSLSADIKSIRSDLSQLGKDFIELRAVSNNLFLKLTEDIKRAHDRIKQATAN